MEVKERRPYRSLTARRDTERRYTSSSADSEDGGKVNPKGYSSSETLKAFDQESRMAAYGSRVKDMVHHEADEFCRPGEEQTVYSFIQGKHSNKINNNALGMNRTVLGRPTDIQKVPCPAAGRER